MKLIKKTIEKISSEERFHLNLELIFARIAILAALTIDGLAPLIIMKQKSNVTTIKSANSCITPKRLSR